MQLQMLDKALMYFEILKNEALWTLASALSECKTIRVDKDLLNFLNRTQKALCMKGRKI